MSEPVDILLTHIGLPDMSGILLAEYALARNPEAKRHLYDWRLGDLSVRNHLPARTLVKPFLIDALLAMIASVGRAERK